MWKLFQAVHSRKRREFLSSHLKINWVLGFSVIFISAAFYPIFAQETSVASRVDNLRKHLSEIQVSYSETQNPTNRVKILRQELRVKFGNLLQKATSSEATLAIYRADAESTLKVIHAYEATLSSGKGEATTFWNVLSEPDIKQAKESVRSQLNSLRQERLNYPPEHIPLKLEFRVRELEVLDFSIESEILRRGRLNGQIRLKPIRGDLTVDEARRRFAIIKNHEEPFNLEKNFQEELRRQVEFRINTVSEDAALTALRKELPKFKPPSTSLDVSAPPKSLKSAQQLLQATQIEEISAVMRDDLVAVAKARAQNKTIGEWINHSSGKRAPVAGMGFSETNSDELLDLRNKWKSWQDNLIAKDLADPNQENKLRIAESKNRIKEIAAHLESKLLPRPPPDDGAAGGALGINDPPPGKNGGAFETTWKMQLANNELTELAKAANEPGPFKNAEIKTEIHNAIKRKTMAQAEIIRNAYNDTLELQRRLIVSGRGTETEKFNQKLLEVREKIKVRASYELLNLNSISDPQISAFQEVKDAKNILKNLASPGQNPKPGKDLVEILSEIEIASQNIETNTKSNFVEIRAIDGKELRAMPENSIRLSIQPPESGSLRIGKPPEEFTDLYPDKNRSDTLKKLLKDPRRAPGGVVVDAKLPDDLIRRLNGLTVDVKTGAVTANLDGVVRKVNTQQDPLLARLAWAFAIDGRAVLIDLRTLSTEEALWLKRQHVSSRLSETETEGLINALSALTSVNVNDAFRNTSLVPKLILTDQLMFDLLPRGTLRLEGEDSRYGLPLDGLRKAFRKDAGADLNRPNWNETLFNKSILAVSDISYKEEEDLTIEPKLSFHLFGVPAQGSETFPLKASEEWFNSHEKQLRQTAPLAWLNDFAVLTVLFRTVNERNITNNLNDLINVSIPEYNSPRFILRKNQAPGGSWESLRRKLSKEEK